ncbi:MAG TPA: STAS domain-containing protein [Iamia sp.]|nr:STAS domain-containing protein [Iamia sp.]
MVDDAIPEPGVAQHGGGLRVEPVGDPTAGSLHLTGELDAASGEELLAAGRDAIALGATALSLELADLRFCDSAGLRALVLLSREVEGSLVLVEPSPMLVRLLEVTGLSEAFTLA